MKTILIILFAINLSLMSAQENEKGNLPYHKIPDIPESYTAGTVVSRMIDGLGFRYYWATEGLTDENLLYKPSESNRTISETVDHLYQLSLTIYNSAVKEVNDRTQPRDTNLTFKQKRIKTLQNLRKASTIFSTAKDLAEHQIVFKSQRGTAEFPFWNQINGPIEDAIWHSGQIVALRRAAGNPIDPGVNVFLGIRREN
ncbi:DinB family protein [Muriicola sp. Z0-33]|uniref:DinB family protein n=1 Tax=Muriicola sp. Z0-33 TaxID=2816957 RepID=UPI0022384A8D|nr:hypothetical protein [Muriicola sp. Z0-33]MCW5517283.1 hypothetical protein [Muriicola sp. Z0-33]